MIDEHRNVIQDALSAAASDGLDRDSVVVSWVAVCDIRHPDGADAIGIFSNEGLPAWLEKSLLIQGLEHLDGAFPMPVGDDDE